MKTSKRIRAKYRAKIRSVRRKQIRHDSGNHQRWMAYGIVFSYETDWSIGILRETAVELAETLRWIDMYQKKKDHKGVSTLSRYMTGFLSGLRA